MKRAGFWPAVGLALLLSALGWFIYTVSAHWLGGRSAVRLVLLVVALVYVLYLLSGAAQRSGRIVALGAWLLLAGVLLLGNPPLSAWLLLLTGFIWLLRCLLRYQSLLNAAADALLSCLALGAAVSTALHTQNLALSLWSYFLVQAFCEFLPNWIVGNSGSKDQAGASGLADAGAQRGDHQQDFETALSHAQGALRRLSQRH